MEPGGMAPLVEAGSCTTMLRLELLIAGSITAMSKHADTAVVVGCTFMQGLPPTVTVAVGAEALAEGKVVLAVTLTVYPSLFPPLLMANVVAFAAPSSVTSTVSVTEVLSVAAGGTHSEVPMGQSDVPGK